MFSRRGFCKLVATATAVAVLGLKSVVLAQTGIGRSSFHIMDNLSLSIKLPARSAACD